jgi:hypothetical protein
VGVRVRVGISIPLKNPYPWQGSKVLIITFFYLQKHIFPSEIFVYGLYEGILPRIRVLFTRFGEHAVNGEYQMKPPWRKYLQNKKCEQAG